MAWRRLSRGTLCAGVAAVLAGLGGAVGVGVASAGSSYPSTLTGGQTLTAGQQLQSADGHFELTMQSDGNLVQYLTQNQRPLWSSNTHGYPGAEAVLEPDGDLNVVSASGNVLWSDNAATAGCPTLDVLENGTVQVYGPSSSVWSTPPQGPVVSMIDGDQLDSGQAIDAPNDDFEVVMQSDGDLEVENTAGTVLWSSGTSGNPGAYAELGSDGDLTVNSPSGTQLWTAGANGQANDVLYMQNDGNLVLYTPGNGPNTGSSDWASNTANAATGSGSFAPTPQYGSSSACPAAAAAPAATVTVTAPTSTTLTVAAPVPATHLTRTVSVPVAFDWTWRGAFSYVRHVAFIHRVPAGLTVSVTITPARTAHRRARPSVETATTARGREELLVRLEHDRFSVGESLALEIAHRGYRPQTNTFRIRLHATPAVEGSVVRKPTTRHR